ncbi:MAG: class I SAM-dependent methyltransferase [Bradyrhizobiaceae bacterium]|nr:class I SAM-dependent methyltransferase [Bradyrhizobiaceae bacterium]
MEHDKPSHTAGHVAALRGLGVLLPPAGRLVDDRFGAEWTGWACLRRLAAAWPGAAQRLSRPMWRWLLYMQVRTFALDQEVARFAQQGGRQLILLGAGLDARALRLRHLGLTVFEVDHPATQARKRRLLGDAATFAAFDFEHDPLGELPQRLADLGYRREERGCVVWEGVTMYLSEATNAATFAMLADLLAPASAVAFTYFAKDLLAAPGWHNLMMRQFVASRGEPWVFGWEPEHLPAWLAARGFALEHDDSTLALAARMLPADLAARVRDDQRRIALARRDAVTP